MTAMGHLQPIIARPVFGTSWSGSRGQLVNPHVIKGPLGPIDYRGTQCWIIEVAFRVQGDNRQHLVVVGVTENNWSRSRRGLGFQS
jgi:hypothetical protein